MAVRLLVTVATPLAVIVAMSLPAGAASASTAAPASTASTSGRPAAPAVTAHAVPRAAQVKLPAHVRRACPAPAAPARAWSCFALIRTTSSGRVGSVRPGEFFPGAYKPADLQSAYSLAAAAKAGGTGVTVAIVDAGADPHAAADLAAYRTEWGLPACVPKTGAGCVTQVNQEGKTSPLPMADPSGGWEVEESLDMDMVSAICPHCHILLVVANAPDASDLSTAVNTAVALGARYVSNSYGGAPTVTNQPFDHPGVAIVASSGDFGYGTAYPASSPTVTSVGGTSLYPAPGTKRGWTETAWDGTGSGCADFSPKPSWQTTDNSEPAGCLDRTDNDVSAVADPNTGVWIYDTTLYQGQPVDWMSVGGTSASAPIVTATYALAGTPAPRTYPASYLYLPGRAASLNDVTSGSNGYCDAARAYLCRAVKGYDAPTGWGTPDGTAAFAPPTGRVVTVSDPGVQDVVAGHKFRLTMTALDSALGATLTFAAAGLPKGLSIGPSTGVLSGTLPTAGGTSILRVTATDASGAHGTAVFRIVIAANLRAGYHPVTGPVTLGLTHACLDDAGNGSANGTRAIMFTCESIASQKWTYEPDAIPDGSGTLVIHGKCLATAGNANGAKLVLETCNGAPGEGWSLQFGAQVLYNPASGRCMDAPRSANNTQVEIDDCGFASPQQAFFLPPGPVLSALGRTCLTDPGNSTHSGTKVIIAPCTGGAAQAWDVFSRASATATRTHGGLCLDVASLNVPTFGVFVAGTPVTLGPCNSATTFYGNTWLPLPDGEVINADAGLCLAVTGNSAATGSTLELNDCYGDLGEIWAEG